VYPDLNIADLDRDTDLGIFGILSEHLDIVGVVSVLLIVGVLKSEVIEVPHGLAVSHFSQKVIVVIVIIERDC
jgi:hypothetical protein